MQKMVLDRTFKVRIHLCAAPRVCRIVCGCPERVSHLLCVGLPVRMSSARCVRGGSIRHLRTCHFAWSQRMFNGLLYRGFRAWKHFAEHSQVHLLLKLVSKLLPPN